MKKTEINFQDLRDKWPSTIVARDKVEEFTGGLITRGTMTNLDSRGEGPPKFYLGPRKVAYFVETFIPWLEARVAKAQASVRQRRPNGTFERNGKAKS